MKLLLDENLPHALRHEIPGHDVYTVGYMKWGGVQNGALLQLATDEGFDALITNDRGLEYQQNISTLPLAVVVLLADANTIEAIRPHYPNLFAALSHLVPRSFVKVAAS